MSDIDEWYKKYQMSDPLLLCQLSTWKTTSKQMDQKKNNHINCPYNQLIYFKKIILNTHPKWGERHPRWRVGILMKG